MNVYQHPRSKKRRIHGKSKMAQLENMFQNPNSHQNGTNRKGVEVKEARAQVLNPGLNLWPGKCSTLLRFLYFYLKDRLQRGKTGNNLYPLFHSPDVYDHWSWAEPGARSFSWGSRVGVGSEELGPFSPASPDYKQVEELGYQPAPIPAPVYTGWVFRWANHQSPITNFLKYLLENAWHTTSTHIHPGVSVTHLCHWSDRQLSVLSESLKKAYFLN